MTAHAGVGASPVALRLGDDVRLICGDTFTVLPTLDAGSVDAIVTSPPYADQRDLGIHLDLFVDWITPVLEELYRVASPQAGFMLNLGRIFRDGEEHPYIDLVAARAREIGWRRKDTIVWHKLNAHPFTAPEYLHNKHELVLWFGRTLDTYRGYTEETRSPHAPESIARHARAGKRGPKNRSGGGYQPSERTPLNADGVKPASVFECYIGREKGTEHDSPMALELADHLVCLACPPGGVVLDPFAGGGTTLVAARAHGRRSIGIELVQRHLDEARARLEGVPLPALPGRPASQLSLV